jgi:hypothetical protein
MNISISQDKFLLDFRKARDAQYSQNPQRQLG